MRRCIARHKISGGAVLSLFAIAAVGGVQAQPAPEPPDWDRGFIWDAFEYRNSHALTGTADWCVADPGELPSSPEKCQISRVQAWYRTNWAERSKNYVGDLVTGAPALPGRVALNLLDGITYEWGSTATFISGFTWRTGTWHARVRLQDLTLSQPGVSTSFWMMSPYWACANVTPGASCTAHPEKYWSEWNFEWTTFWNVHRGSTGPWMSTGALTDGEATIVGASPLQGNESADDFTCRAPDGTVLPWDTCRLYFINGVDAPDPEGPFVDLMVQFDGIRARWEVVAHAHNASLPHAWVEASATSPVLGAGQPVMTIFSATPKMGVEMDRNRWLVAEWFLYTPEPNLSIEEMVAAASWLQDEAGYSRLNTTGTALSRPRTSTGIHLETAGDGLDEGEFLVLLPQNQLTYYDVFWSYRTTDRVDASGDPVFESGWIELPDHSMRVLIPETRQHLYSEVKVAYRLHRDSYGLHVGPVPMEAEDEVCAASSDRGRSYDKSCISG